MVDYSVRGRTPSQHPKEAIVTKKTSLLPREELQYRSESTPRAEKRAMWGANHKNVASMKDLVRKFSIPGDVVLDF